MTIATLHPAPPPQPPPRGIGIEDRDRRVRPHLPRHRVEADEQLAGVRGASVDQVGDYLRHIGRLSLLTAEEEAQIARRIEVGLFAEEKLATEKGLAKTCSVNSAGSSVTVSAPRSA